MRTLAIGDIHGCTSALDALWAKVAPSADDDQVVFLGDYVSRGPDSAGVMNRLVRWSKTHRIVALRGNHEQMMMEARESVGQLEVWRSCGGDAALSSYDVLGDGGRLADVPDEHWEFLGHFCRDWFETDTHIFVHAGAYAELEMDEQPTLILRWEVFNDPPPHQSGKVLVCGHTPQKTGVPRNIRHAVCIDTAVLRRDGWLTCLDVTAAQVYQANQRGETRRSWLDEHLVES